MSMDATDHDWDKLIVATDACNYESVGYMGTLDDFVVKKIKEVLICGYVSESKV
jgi:hypothetical protein